MEGVPMNDNVRRGVEAAKQDALEAYRSGRGGEDGIGAKRVFEERIQELKELMKANPAAFGQK